MNNALILIRTPLQAYVVEKIIELEKIQNYEVLYITTNNSEEDINYFNKLKLNSINAKYLYIKNSKSALIYYIKLYIKAYKWLKPTQKLILLSSIDLYLFRTIIAKRNKNTKIITFDDGIENYKINGRYNYEITKFKFNIFKIILNFEDLNKIKKSISFHYALNNKLINIIESKRVKSLKLWTNNYTNKSTLNEKIIFFIGEPFNDFMTPNQIIRIKSYLKTLDIDYYVKHPREEILINDEIKLLNKKGKIAEEAIIDVSGNKEIILIGWMSSVMLNLSQIVKQRIVFLMNEDNNAIYEMIAKKSGCEIIFI